MGEFTCQPSASVWLVELPRSNSGWVVCGPSGPVSAYVSLPSAGFQSWILESFELSKLSRNELCIYVQIYMNVYVLYSLMRRRLRSSADVGPAWRGRLTKFILSWNVLSHRHRFIFSVFSSKCMFSGLCGGKWSQQLCTQWPVPDLFWLLPRPLWGRVSRTASFHNITASSLFFLFPWSHNTASVNNYRKNLHLHVLSWERERFHDPINGCGVVSLVRCTGLMTPNSRTEYDSAALVALSDLQL